jgi:hypothetical protein
MGRKKTIENQAVLYKMIYEAVGESCPIFNSNHYNVQGCDGVHMNCRSEYGNAKAWALEAAEFILHHL